MKMIYSRNVGIDQDYFFFIYQNYASDDYLEYTSSGVPSYCDLKSKQPLLYDHL